MGNKKETEKAGEGSEKEEPKTAVSVKQLAEMEEKLNALSKQSLKDKERSAKVVAKLQERLAESEKALAAAPPEPPADDQSKIAADRQAKENLAAEREDADREEHELAAYWYGTTKTSPWQNYGIEDIEFQHYTEKVEHDDGELVTRRSRRPGAVVKLERKKVKRLQSIISAAVVTAGAPGRRRVLKNISRPLREGENRLSEYLYLLPVNEAVAKYGPAWRENPPTVE